MVRRNKRRIGALAIVAMFVALFFLPGVIADGEATGGSEGSYRYDIDSNNNEDDRVFRVTHDGVTEELFRIQENGNVGIGTTSPDRKLEILDSSDPQLKLSVSDTYCTELQTTSNGYLYINPSDGRVGIETDGPISTLSVAGGVAVGSTWANTHPAPANGMIIEGSVGIGAYNIASKLHVSGGGLLVTGTTGSTPDLGGGTRLMWVPAKAAFRAGAVTGGEWNDYQVGINSIALGYTPIASGLNSVAIGTGGVSYGESSNTIGYYNTAMSLGSVAIGNQNTADDTYAIAIGSWAEASGRGSTSMGYHTTANEDYSTAMGYYTTANGEYSTAMGSGGEASGDYSTSMGCDTEASGDYSTSMGYYTTASGSRSTAMGSCIIVQG